MPAAWLERHQLPVYLGALVVGAGVGWAAPAAAPALEQGVYPALAALLYATFLQQSASGTERRNGQMGGQPNRA